jgi:hypothetical protein
VNEPVKVDFSRIQTRLQHVANGRGRWQWGTMTNLSQIAEHDWNEAAIPGLLFL